MNIVWEEEVFIPAYRHLVENNDRYLVLWGGRDSGKSYFAAQKMIYDCLRLPYFRCILVKKTYESIKDSQYQTIKDIVFEYGLDSIFDFKLSPLEILCKVNGNRFIARGCDKPEKLKSIKDPSHAWYEEANHLTYEDFATITSTIRGGETNQEIFSFNPEYTTQTIDDFWIHKIWFKDAPKKSFSGRKIIDIDGEKIELPYTVLHSTYHDNPYCKPERKAILEGYKDISPYMYDVFTKGEWSVLKVESPFITAFFPDKHISDKAIFENGKEIILSFDFNVDNTFCIFAHHSHNHIHVFDELSANDLPLLIEKILAKYGQYVFMFKVTGDYAGNARNALSGGSLTPYVLIKTRLNLKNNQLRLIPNPKHSYSRFVCNTVFAYYNNFFINPKCTALLFDIQNVECNINEEIVKKDRNVANQKADALDCLRYFLYNFHLDFVKRYKI